MAESSRSFREHNHISRYTIGLVRSGCLCLQRKDGTTLYRQGDCFVISPYEPHSISAVDPYTLISVCIQAEYADHHTLEDIRARVDALLNAIPVAYHLSETEELLLPEAMGRMLTSLHEDQDMDRSLGTIRDRMIREPEQDFRIDECSQSIHHSKYHLIRSFKKAVGLTPHRFQVQLRIRRAKELLVSPNFESIAEVASSTGFCDQSHFVHAFKTVVGMTPTDYILAQRRNDCL